MNSDSIFYKDDLVGEFSGNILDEISVLFPYPVSEKITAHKPIYSEWKVYERITWEGKRGFRYYVSKGVSAKVFTVISSVYSVEHQDKHYPEIFDGTKDNLPLSCFEIGLKSVDGKEEITVRNECFVIWLPNKVEIPER